MAKKIDKKKIQAENEVLSPTVQLYIKTLQEAIDRMEASEERITPSKKVYIEALKENIKRAPQFLKNSRSLERYLKASEPSEENSEPQASLEDTNETEPAKKARKSK